MPAPNHARLQELLDARIKFETKKHMDKVKSYSQHSELDALVRVVVETSFKQGFAAGTDATIDIISTEAGRAIKFGL